MFESFVLLFFLFVFFSLGWLCLVHTPYTMTVDRVELGFSRLPSSLDGLRILFLGDLHCRCWTFREIWLRQTAADWQADIVLLSGDLVEPEGLDDFLELLPSLLAPMGTYMVPGNNENLEHDRNQLFKELRTRGVTLLINECVEAAPGLTIAGVDDPSRDNDDLGAALQNCPESGMIILLSHTPETFPDAVKYRVPLVLAGHTHGGQVRLPFVGALWTDTPRTGLRYDQGLFHEGDSTLIVTRGIGTSKLPVRMLSYPQVHLITLRCENLQAGD